MEVKSLLDMLKEKNILGDYGPWRRPYVVLDVDEYHAILEALESKPKRGRPKKLESVPHEAIR